MLFKDITIVYVPIDDLIDAEYNPRKASEKDFADLKENMAKFGFVDPVICNSYEPRKNVIIGGHFRRRVAKALGHKLAPVVYLEVDNIELEKELNVRLNKNTGSFDFDLLANLFDVDDLKNWGFSELDLGLDFGKEEKPDTGVSGSLASKFIVPPFSVLDTRQGHWKERKEFWKDLIGDNGESREGTLSESEMMGDINNGVSVLDPVLAEIANLWFGIKGGKTFDCFAGDTVFGYVSGYLGNSFTGIELRQEQVDLNNSRVKDFNCKYICDDGQNVNKHIEKESQDLLFSCPPYFDLEVYSDLANDASNQKEYKDFVKILDNAFSNAIKCLKNDRFAFIVIGDIRDKKGFYRGFADDIKHTFINNGMGLYNELILVEPLGTLPQRVQRYMNNRKIGKCHQNILVFYKGDPKNIKSNFDEIQFEYESEDME